MSRSVQPGTRIGPYEILEPLGAGGMGEVYRARDMKLGRDVAIKVLPVTVAADADRMTRFEREARLLATLNHKNIGAIYGLESAHGAPALVLELIEGPTLADRIKEMTRGGARVKEALGIAQQIADALDAAHERGIVHRDLKPANVKIANNGVVKVLDFGLAKSQAEPGGDVANSPTVTVDGTHAGTILGTAGYMSPEQARGKLVDKRTDIWSFGCVLFEMLAGERAFHGETASDLIAAILDAQPNYSRLPAATSPAIRRLLQRCLEKDPRRRLRDIADAGVDIDDELSGSAVAAAPAATRSPRFSSMLTAAAIALLIGGPAAGWMAARRLTETPPPAFDRVVRIVATAAHENSPVISPDGKWIAYLSNASGTTDVWVKFLAGGDPVNLTAGKGHEVQSTDYVAGLAVSPDGSQLAFTVSDGGASQAATYVIPAPLGGEPHKLLNAGQYGTQWSPDGQHIAFVQAGGPLGDALIVADPDGQHPTVLAKREGARHIHWPRWSGDGKYIYFNHGPQNFNIEPTEVYRVPVAGGPIEPVVATARRAAFPFANSDGTGLIYAANPDTVDLNLWWRDLRTGRDTRLISGVGEYTHPMLSSDGRFLIGTVLDSQQSLQRVSIEPGKPSKVEPITDGHSGDFDPWLTANGALVFSSSRTGSRNLWLARAAGGAPVPLTSGKTFDERPAVSPDGKEIAFVSDRSGHRAIWLLSADGGTPRLLANADVVDTLSWSPDGAQLVYATPNGDKPSLTVLNVATGQTTPLDTPRAATGPTWSRDNVIAFVEPRGGQLGAFIQLIRPNGERIASSGLDTNGSTQIANGSIVWSPDGKRLAASSLPGAAAGKLLLVDPSSETPYRTLVDLPPGVFIRGITWSNDGQSLIVGTYKWSGDIFLAERSTPKP